MGKDERETEAVTPSVRSTGVTPDEERSSESEAEAVEHLTEAAAAALRGDEYEADVEEFRSLNVSWSDIAGEILRVQEQATGAPAPAIPIDRFDDGLPIYETWLEEAGGREMLDLIRELYDALTAEHGAENVKPLSTRTIRLLRRMAINWMREHEADYFEPIECPACGERFHPTAPRTTNGPRYCSGACRQKAYRRRRALDKEGATP